MEKPQFEAVKFTDDMYSSGSESDIEYMLTIPNESTLNKQQIILSNSTYALTKINGHKQQLNNCHSKKNSSSTNTEFEMPIKQESPANQPVIPVIKNIATGATQESLRINLENVFKKIKQEKFRVRERNLSGREKNVLIKLFRKYPDLQNHSSSSEVLYRKKQAYEDVHKEFTALCPDSSDRSLKFIKGCFKRLKRDVLGSHPVQIEEETVNNEILETINDGILDSPLIHVISLSNPNSASILKVTDSPRSATLYNNVEEKEISTEEGNTDLTKDVSVTKNVTVQESADNYDLLPLKTLQRKALELAIEAEKERLAAYRYEKEAQKYNMKAAKVRYETQLLKKEAAYRFCEQEE